MPDLTDRLYGDERNALVLRMAQDVHAFAAPVRPFRARAGELLYDAPWRFESGNPAWAHCLADFSGFLARMGCAPDRHARPAGRVNSAALSVRVNPALPPAAALVDAAPGRVVLEAADIRGAWRGLVWMEREMAWRHAPILPAGRHRLGPHFAARITTSLFAPGLEDPADPLAYTEPYLRSMVHCGYTGFFIYINLWEYIRSRVLPELDAPAAERKLAELQALAARAAACGLEVYPLLAAPGFTPAHPVFKAHPELRGGTSSARRLHALCASVSRARKFFAEQVARLCGIRPAPGGLIFIIGGEGFRHCYTTPNPRTARVTNCPRCARRRPAAVLAPLLNAMTRAIRRAAPGTRAIYWPYSSFVWQKKPVGKYKWQEDLALISRLDRRSTWMLDLEKDAAVEIPGVGATQVYDYSIQYIGPSPKFILESAAACRRAVELAVKTETTQTIELFSLPYIPVMQRWEARHAAIRQSDAALVLETWRLNGFWPAPSVELAFWLTMAESLPAGEALRRVACRVYGARAAGAVLRAWQAFSRAWETSYARYGTYWDGPLFLGPAHPFDLGTAFLVRNVYSPAFYHVSPGAREHGDPQILADPQRLRPKFHLLPGRWARARRRDYARAAAHWRRGMAQLQRALRLVPPALRKPARADYDMADMVGLFLEADLAFNTFAALRDELNQTYLADPGYRRRLQALDAVLQADLARSRRGLAIARRNPFIGWGYTFGARFNGAMIEEKIRHTQALRRKVQACLAGGEALLV